MAGAVLISHERAILLGRRMARRRAGWMADKERDHVGLCAHCRHVRRIKSDRGSIFYQCGLARTDPNFSKYPALPVIQCPGYERAQSSGDEQS